MSDFLIRTRDGRMVAAHEGTAVSDLIRVPDGETAERFDTRDEFEARLAELAPDPGPDPDDEFDAAIEAASTLDELKSALLGKGGNARAAARRADR